ncbi:MAG: YccF domain-containing protein [Deltaproteobacteria bacterium]
MLRFVGNILWVIFGGFEMALGWAVAALLFAVSIVGIPWAKAAAMMAWFTIWPFGREAVDRELLTGREDIGTSEFGLIGNVLWFVFAGVWLAIGHVFTGVLLCLTIIGIPFGIQHFKIAMLALAPIGKTVVESEDYSY